MKAHMTLCVATLIWAALNAGAEAESYVVHWTAVEHDVTPVSQNSSHSYMARFRLDGDRFVSEENGQSATTTAGQAALFVTKLGTQHAVTYARRGGAIVRTDVFPGFSLVMLIRSDYGAGCHVGVAYRRLAGHAMFEAERYDGTGTSTARQVEAVGTYCTMTSP